MNRCHGRLESDQALIAKQLRGLAAEVSPQDLGDKTEEWRIGFFGPGETATRAGAGQGARLQLKHGVGSSSELQDGFEDGWGVFLMMPRCCRTAVY